MEDSTFVEETKTDASEDKVLFDGPLYDYRKEVASHDEDYDLPSEPEESNPDSGVYFEETEYDVDKT